MSQFCTILVYQADHFILFFHCPFLQISSTDGAQSLADCPDDADGGAQDDQEGEEEAKGEKENVVTSVRVKTPRRSATNEYLLNN